MAIDTEGTQPSGNEPDKVVTPAAAAKKKAPSDPVANGLLVTILLVVALTLVTVLYAIVGGIFGTGAPRTAGEFKVKAAQAKIQAGSKDNMVWVEYITALIGNGEYRTAQEFIDKGKKTLDKQEIYQDMAYMQATLYAAQGQNDKALAEADAAIKVIKKTSDEAKADSAKTKQPKTAAFLVENQNYWDLLLLKAELLVKKNDQKGALAVYDEYLASKPTAATVFVLRGNAKEKLGDAKGAEADYRQALVYISDDAGALAGLKRIGVAK